MKIYNGSWSTSLPLDSRESSYLINMVLKREHLMQVARMLALMTPRSHAVTLNSNQTYKSGTGYPIFTR